MQNHLLKTLLVTLFIALPATAAKHKKATSSVPVFEVKDETTIVLKASDVESASVTNIKKEDDASAGIFIELKPAATKRFQEYTRHHIGKTLKVFIDGKEVASPMIKTEIESGHLAVDAKMTTEQADVVADRINTHSKR